MREQVKEYLKKVSDLESEAEQEQQRAAEEEREAYKQSIAYQAGLIEKEYNPKGVDAEYDPFYPMRDEDTGRYYRRNILDLTDEELEAVEQALQKEEKLKRKAEDPSHGSTEAKGNSIAKVLKIISICIYAAAGLAGIIVAASMHTFWMFVLIAVAGFVIGTMMFGFSEIIRLLDSINTNVSKN